MVVSEGAINNIMGGMENTAGVRLHSHRHKLKQRFDIIRKLGQGTYGKVQLAVNKETGQEVAIKTIKKAKIETEQDLIRIRREIQIMSSVQHPQIIHIYEVFENREKMVLVMEYAAGGELYDYLSERKVLSEDEARRIFRHVASATYYCHKHKICHRDLKLENILLDLDGNAKIADFGLSNVFDEKHRLDTFCGSPLYASPEIVKGIPYTGPEVDCWSLGVLLYTLVYGAMPFDGSNFKRLVKQITQGDYYEPKKPSRASDLIRQMLTVSATKRATIEDICNHWWVNEGFLEPCLEVAEALANQTPVRLDLLLSLAPKHINSEHMLIQPEEDDSARVSDAKKAFETKPAEKSKVVLRKKPTTESLPSSPTNKEGPKLPTTLSGPITSHDAVREVTPTKDISSSKLNKDKSPVKDVSPGRQELREKSVTKETEKEKSPKKIKELASEEITKPASPRPSITETEVQELEDEVPPADKIEKKVHEEAEEKEKLDEVKSIARIEKPHAGASEKLITPRTSTHAMEVDPLETVTSSEEEESVVVGGLNLKLGGVGKISEVGTKQEVCRAEISDSSDSESEAEKLLKMVSEKREKVEAARQEKLRKVSEAKDREFKNKDMPAIREEPQSKSPSKSPSISPEKAVKLSPSESRESAPEQKFATLPRGFKAKSQRAAAAAAAPSPLPIAEKLRKEDRKDKAISQEIEGMMSAIKAVDQAITKGPGETSQKSQEAQAADRKKTQLEIVLDNKKSDVQEPDLANKRASYAEIKLTSPTAKDTPKTQEYKSEVRHNVGPVHGMGEAQLQRAKRERIIPIMIEDDDDDDDLTTSESLPHSDRPVGTSSSAGSRVTSPLPSQLPNRRTSDPRSPMYKPSPEPIRKSPRERIIPIAVEGEGIVTPPPHVEEAAELGAARAHQAFSRTLSGRPSSLNRGRGFLLDHSESFSSAGEEEEEDEDDGFQILTAESLFSTLLNRVRSLTRKMNADEVRSERGRRSSNRPTPEPNTAPNSAGIGAAHSASSGFWSSLYNSPRDSPARRISETMSRSSLGRDDDTLGGLTSPLWTRSVSRDTSDADTLFSEASTPFGTLPRVRTLRHSLHLPPPRLLPDSLFLSDFS